MSYEDDEAATELFFKGVALKVPFSFKGLRGFCEDLKGGPPERWFVRPWEEACSDGWELSRGAREGLAAVHRGGWRELEAEVAAWSGEVLLYDDPRYPEGLKDLVNPPPAVHVVGRLEALKPGALAVVGSRKITAHDARMARRLVQEISRQGVAVVSGGALGSDGVAHRAAVDLGGVTVAVLPSGLDRPTPQSHRELFAAILRSGGALVSEYAPGTSVRKYHFRRRNALIAALSRGVLVLRAREGSGSLLTVAAAKELGRPCAAIPGHPEDPESKGCLGMLREGAAMVADREDLLAFWRSCRGSISEEPVANGVDAVAMTTGCPVLESARGIRDEEGLFSIDALGAVTEMEAAELQVTLLHHELAGRVERVQSGYRLRG